MELDFDLDPFLEPDTPLDAGRGLDLGASQQAPANSNLIEYDDFLLSEKAASSAVAVPPSDVVVSGWTLDLDLSEPAFSDDTDLPPLTQNDLPALPATPAPATGQPIGFGAVSDRFEARFDLDEDAEGGAKPLKF